MSGKVVNDFYMMKKNNKMLTSSLIKSKLEEIEKRALKNLFYDIKKSSHFQSKRDGGNFIIESVYLATNNESI